MTITEATPTVHIERLQVETLNVPLVGMTPLIVHRFSEKSKKEMMEGSQGKKSMKQPRDPHAEYEACFYRLAGGAYGFPVLALKSATVSAARFYGKSVTMASMRQLLFFRAELADDGLHELVEIEGEPVMREDTVGIGTSKVLRWRPMFPEWAMNVSITYVATSIDRSSVLSLVEAGGLGVGIGDWRPEKSGTFGTYRIDDQRPITVLVDGQEQQV